MKTDLEKGHENNERALNTISHLERIIKYTNRKKDYKQFHQIGHMINPESTFGNLSSHPG